MRTSATRRDVPAWRDVAAAGGVAAFLVLATTHIARGSHERAANAGAYILLVTAGAAVGLCRRWPRTALAVITVVLGAYVGARYPGGPIYVVGWIVLFALSWRTDRRTALFGGAALCAVLAVTKLAVSGGEPLLNLVFVGWSAAAVFLGDALRNRRGYLRELEERARFLEQTREEEGRRRVAEERLRIARDLHDSVAHAIAIINVQAGAAAHVLDRQPAAARPALDAIQHASAEVLDELGAMLGVLRDGQEPARAPTPTWHHIRELTDAAVDAGLPVRLDIEGDVDAISAPVSTAMYRIAQESLTNVMRHAPGSPTRVLIRRGGNGAVTLEVANENSRGSAPSREPVGSGMGIRGMRERAAATGAAFVARRRPEGGFEVVVTWTAQ